MPAYLDSPGQRAIKRVCVCVCVSSIRCTVLHTTVCGLLVVVVAAVICSIGGGIDVDSMVHIKMSVTV